VMLKDFLSSGGPESARKPGDAPKE
jgi:hypothetical protein